jgi:hypothetical protein
MPSALIKVVNSSTAVGKKLFSIAVAHSVSSRLSGNDGTMELGCLASQVPSDHLIARTEHREASEPSSA